MGTVKREPRSWFAAFRRRDEGIAMFAVLSAAAIAGGLAVVSVTAATGTLGRSGRDKMREQALHLAEAAVARGAGQLNEDYNYSTVSTAPIPVTREWVIAQAATRPLEDGREGQFAYVVPGNVDAIYGVGYVPSRAAPRVTRVIEMGYDPARGSGDKAFLTQGNSSVTGSTDVETAGNIHSNSNLELGGSAHITGNATASGTYSQSGNVTIDGTSGGGYAPVDIPEVVARDYRSSTTIDLCPDGLARATASLPCTGSVVGSGLLFGYQGWTWVGAEWRLAGATGGNLGYYVYQSNVLIDGSVGTTSSPWLGTIIVESLVVNGVKLNGDIRQTGTTHLRALDDGIAMVAERDVHISGNGSVEGLVLAGEQAEILGSAVITGQVISASSVNTIGSPVAEARLTGNATVVSRISAPSSASTISPLVWREL